LEEFNKAIARVCNNDQGEKDMALMQAVLNGSGLSDRPEELKKWSDSILEKLKKPEGAELDNKEICALKLMTGVILSASREQPVRDSLNLNQGVIINAARKLDNFCKVELGIVKSKMLPEQVETGKKVLLAAGVEIWPAATSLLKRPKQKAIAFEEPATRDEVNGFLDDMREMLKGGQGKNRVQQQPTLPGLGSQ
jgi:hypothetical protein